MTNLDYIKNNLTETDLCILIMPYAVDVSSKANSFSNKIFEAWETWKQSFSSNHGNLSKGNHNGKIISENPSIWDWEIWNYPDGSKKKMGRTARNSFSVWLSLQYNPLDWAEK